MPTSQPAYPTQRAFVVQIHTEADMAQGEVRGRVEHIVTGQATHFETVEALVQFIVQVLKS
ncbi:MAG TPA: hypothetical protein VIG57_15965 [Candidatus Entotheonella sp.]|jgi:hypothetical protein